MKKKLLFAMMVSSIMVTSSACSFSYDPELAKQEIAQMKADTENRKEMIATLEECGVKNPKIEHDELLDNAHEDGETGYRVSGSGLDNIIMYIGEDGEINSIRYADYDLYKDGELLATVDDYAVSIDEFSTYQVICENAVKSVLKSPSSAKFPLYDHWGCKKEKDTIMISGYVDADNSFGASLRSEFLFTINTETKEIQSFIFDGQEMMQ